MSEATQLESPQLDQLIFKLKMAKKDLAHAEAEAKALRGTKNSLEMQLLEAMDELGLKQAGSSHGMVSLADETLPTVDKDRWEEVWTFIFQNGYLELLRRQLNSTAFKELQQLGVEIPGVTPFVRRNVNLRSR